MSPFGLLCALICNALLAGVLVVVALPPPDRGWAYVMPAVLASLLVTFAFERLLRGASILSVRTLVFVVGYPLGVGLLIALFMMLGIMARPGGPPLFESLLAAVMVSFVAVGLLIRELWLAATVGGITAAATTIVFGRVFPGSETGADSAP